MRDLTIAIPGAGASGLAAAVTAARAGARVILCEQSDRVGKKILRTGNGRCNLTNTGVDPAAYSQPGFVAPALMRTDSEALRAWFRALGLWSYVDAQGRAYPVSETASSVLDVLRMACAELGVETRTDCGVTEIARQGEGFTLYSTQGRFRADRVIVCTGGGTALMEALGHETIPFEPVLCPMRTEKGPIRGLDGLRTAARVTMRAGGQVLFDERGEVLFRDYGVSGIVIFDLSRYWRRGAVLTLDLLPDVPEAELAAALAARREQFPARTGEAFFTGILHARLAQAVRRAAAGDTPEALAAAIKHFTLPLLGRGDAKQAQVTRGGACVEGFDSATMASRLVPGLYACGEALDVDGRCGGYNLHWAFASGICAGEAAANA